MYTGRTWVDASLLACIGLLAFFLLTL